MEKEFHCEVCKGDWDIDSIRMLTCRHVICVDCLKDIVEAAIGPDNQEGVVQKMRCPIKKNCEGKIDRFIVSKNFPELFEAYSAAMAGRGLINAMKDNEVLLYGISSVCPTPECKFRSLARKKDKKITCVDCKTSYCPHCKLPPHNDQTCEAASEASPGKRQPL